MLEKVGVPRKTEKKICEILRGLLPRKKVRMNIVQGGPASLGGETDNCFRERVYLKDGKAEEVLKKSFISPFSSKTIYFLTLNGKKLTNICGTVQNELLFLALV